MAAQALVKPSYEDPIFTFSTNVLGTMNVLEAARGSVRVLHVHGAGLEFERVLDYPVEAWSWSDRLPGNPTLAELRARTGVQVVLEIRIVNGDLAKFFEYAMPLAGGFFGNDVAMPGVTASPLLSALRAAATVPRTSSLETVRNMVASGLGVSVLPRDALTPKYRPRRPRCRQRRPGRATG